MTNIKKSNANMIRNRMMTKKMSARILAVVSFVPDQHVGIIIIISCGGRQWKMTMTATQ